MSQTLTISDNLYTRLEDVARLHGLGDIEQLIEQLIEMWQARADELRRREEVVQQIDMLRGRLFTRYGQMPDSAELLRVDRER
ncbi:MAG: hypothetical protein HUU32_05255 [Calditrichaceae bacterium]|nr:hypothetical protein [Calditrichia bacterium]NUQ40782.1 hypothetical protein [Calditrichaceae bacterium]